MRIFARSIFAMMLLVLFYSCKKQSFLDATQEGLSEQDVFTDSTRTMGFLNAIYAKVNFSIDSRRFGSTGMHAAADEAEGPKQASPNTYLQFVTASVNPISVSGEAFNTSYQQIRAVNKFLGYISRAPFAQSQRSRAKGEALFLRAWYYSIMLKHYGGVPIVGDTVYNRTDNISSVRSTYAETVNYIVAQCDSASKYLSRNYDQLNYGRATTGACAALKARVLLYAASPLFNNANGPFKGTAQEKLVSYGDYDLNRWKLAADAAAAVMNMGYNLYTIPTSAPDFKPGLAFYRLFYANRVVNDEFIFRGSLSGGGLQLDADFGPPSRGGRTNLNGSYPYQELVDSYPMINGKPIAESGSGYDMNNPYIGRDPRLDYTVMRNEGMKLDYYNGNKLQPVFTYVGAAEDGVYTGTATGYYVNKMLRDSSANDYILSGVDRFYPLLRYAETLLNFAEATNEFSGPSSAIYNALIDIRRRAGISAGTDGLYGLKANMDKDEMRRAIQLERKLELAFEDHRFWDVRRWLIAPDIENRAYRGMEIRRTTSGAYTYKTFLVRQHRFVTANYFWPFPQSEISKPGGLVQNPGY